MKKLIALCASLIVIVILMSGCMSYHEGEYIKKGDLVDIKMAVDTNEAVFSARCSENYCVVKFESDGNSYAALLPCDASGNATVTVSLSNQYTSYYYGDYNDEENTNIQVNINTNPSAIVRMQDGDAVELDSASEADSNAWKYLILNSRSDDGVVLADELLYDPDTDKIEAGDNLSFSIPDSPENVELSYTIHGCRTFPAGMWVEIERIPIIQHEDSIRVQFSKREIHPVESMLVWGGDDEDGHYEVKNGGEYLKNVVTDSFWEKERD